MTPLIVVLVLLNIFTFLGGLWLGYATKVKDAKKTCESNSLSPAAIGMAK